MYVSKYNDLSTIFINLELLTGEFVTILNIKKM